MGNLEEKKSVTQVVAEKEDRGKAGLHPSLNMGLKSVRQLYGCQIGRRHVLGTKMSGTEIQRRVKDL